MWWSNWRSRTLLAAGLAMSLAACGFQPLYKKDAPDSGVAVDLTRIRVQNVQTAAPEFDRLGQIMHGMLVQRLNPDGTRSETIYRLETDLYVTRERTGIQITDEATRARLTISARFTLIAPGKDGTLYSGTEQSVNSYNIVDSQFATLSAENDAARRAIREISEAIRLRLGLYFQRQGNA
jgi:LPS-assembly lipoprotein